MKTIIITFLTLGICASGLSAKSITHNSTSIDVDFVDIGYTNNTSDNSGYGSVSYFYRIGKFEITESQWKTIYNIEPEIGPSQSYPDLLDPASNVSWFEAAKFANWLTSGSYSNGAYQFSDPDTLTGIDRDSALFEFGTVYVLPNENEWYKAAYFKADGTGYVAFSTGDEIPSKSDVRYDTYSPWHTGSGIAEINGTYDMTGNINEWCEAAADGNLDNMNEQRILRGGSFYYDASSLNSSNRFQSSPPYGYLDAGFRVAELTQPPVSIHIDHSLIIKWHSTSGHVYQAQYSTNLVSANWFNLGSAVLATNSSCHVSDSVNNIGERYYRITK